MKVLIADDDRATQVRLKSYLNEWGYESVAALDGEQAWEILLNDESIRLVISDWVMPGMSGIDLIKKIKSMRRPYYIYILLLTGNTGKENLITGLEADAQDFMTKPVDKEVLRARILGAERVLRLEQHLGSQNQRLQDSVEELSRSNKALREFTSIVSHDLQEPLRTVSSFVKLTKSKLKDHLDDKTREYMDFVTDGTERMRNLITDLLDYSKVRSGDHKMSSVDCNEVFDAVLGNLEASISEKGAKVTRGDLPTVMADRTRMGMLFQNLIANGIKYQKDRAPEVRVESRNEAGFWITSVADNGIGIEERFLKDIFEPFRRLHSTSEYSGTGIGLANCVEIVTQHGGKIWVESEFGNGATFFFTWPGKM